MDKPASQDAPGTAIGSDPTPDASRLTDRFEARMPRALREKLGELAYRDRCSPAEWVRRQIERAEL